MAKFNLKITDIKKAYQQGLLPQRNNKHYFYQDSSCRCLLQGFSPSSENRRILKKTSVFHYTVGSIQDFSFNLDILKKTYSWSQQQGWDFPKSSIKNVFTNHIFNYVYTWFNENNTIIGYAICLFEKDFSHIAYVFYHPDYNKQSLPIKMCLQTILDSIDKNLKFCYLGRFDPISKIGFYKRNFPQLQVYDYHQGIWQKYRQ